MGKGNKAHICIVKFLFSGSPYSSSDSLLYDYMSDQAGSEEREQAGAAVIAVPSFVSAAQDLVVNMGDTVRLPCQVDRLQVSCQRISVLPLT